MYFILLLTWDHFTALFRVLFILQVYKNWFKRFLKLHLCSKLRTYHTSLEFEDSRNNWCHVSVQKRLHQSLKAEIIRREELILLSLSLQKISTIPIKILGQLQLNKSMQSILKLGIIPGHFSLIFQNMKLLRCSIKDLNFPLFQTRVSEGATSD